MNEKLEKEENVRYTEGERKCFGQFGEFDECRPDLCRYYEICKREHIDCYKGSGF